MRTYNAARAAAGAAGQNIREEQLRDGRTEAKVKRGSIDLPFFVLTLVILTIGVVMVLSASFARAYYTSGNPLQYFTKQIFFAVTGIALMIFFSYWKVETFRKYAFPILIVSLLLLAAVPVIGTRVNGAKRWIDLGFTTFQPSELAKFSEVLIFAVMICTYKEKMKTFKYGVVPFVIVVAVIVGLLYLEPHLSASVIIVMLAAIMMFAGGTKLQWFILAGGAIIVIAVITVTKMDYANDRITAWLHPENDPGDKAYQILQSLYAIGSGGLMGLGLGQGRQKYLYLPEEHNDYIFAVVCEELGYVGAILILLLFALLIVRGFWLALHARDRFGSLVVTGLTSLLAIQVFLNVAVVTNLLPSTGISLPFFSSGGTALWIQLIEMGIILSISRDIPIVKAG